jgi:hypothetical protein
VLPAESAQSSEKLISTYFGASFDTRTGARNSGSARFHLTIIAQSWSFALRFTARARFHVPTGAPLRGTTCRSATIAA